MSVMNDMNDELYNAKVEIQSLRDQLDTERKRNVLLREALENYAIGGSNYSKMAREALAATADLKDAILCNRESVAIIGTNGHPKHIRHIISSEEMRLYSPFKNLHTHWESR